MTYLESRQQYGNRPANEMMLEISNGNELAMAMECSCRRSSSAFSFLSSSFFSLQEEMKVICFCIWNLDTRDFEIDEPIFDGS